MLTVVCRSIVCNERNWPDAYQARPMPSRCCFCLKCEAETLELGLSQEELAELVGVHRTYEGMVERIEKNATITTIDRLAGALEVEPYLLLQKQ